MRWFLFAFFFITVAALPSWQSYPTRNTQNFIGMRRFLSGIPFQPRDDLVPMKLPRSRREVIIEAPSK